MGARAAQTEHDTRAVVETDDLALVLADRVVDRVRVVEVGDVRYGERLAGALRGVRRLRERAGADVLVQRVYKLLCALRRDLLVVVAGEEGAAVDSIVLLEKLLDPYEFVGGLLVRVREDVQPGYITEVNSSVD